MQQGLMNHRQVIIRPDHNYEYKLYYVQLKSYTKT